MSCLEREGTSPRNSFGGEGEGGRGEGGGGLGGGWRDEDAIELRGRGEW